MSANITESELAGPITRKELEELVNVRGTIFRARVRMEPGSGPGGKVSPPTYPGLNSKERKSTIIMYDGVVGGEFKPCAVLNSVAAGANRWEDAILRQLQLDRAFKVPVIRVRFTAALKGDQGTREILTSSIEQPHRWCDGVLKYSFLDGVPYDKSRIGNALRSYSDSNATPALAYCPTALILGFWNSQDEGPFNAKVARAYECEINALNAVEGRRGAGRIDRLPISNKTPMYVAKDKSLLPWTDDPRLAEMDGNTPRIYAERPSERGLGNIPPNITGGRITAESIEWSASLSSNALRRLRFPVDSRYDDELDYAARTLLAALAIYGMALDVENGFFLRSGCDLNPIEPFDICRARRASEGEDKDVSLGLDVAASRRLFDEALAHARALGLPWEDEIVLQGSPQLQGLVERGMVLYGNREKGGDE